MKKDHVYNKNTGSAFVIFILLNWPMDETNNNIVVAKNTTFWNDFLLFKTYVYLVVLLFLVASKSFHEALLLIFVNNVVELLRVIV